MENRKILVKIVDPEKCNGSADHITLGSYKELVVEIVPNTPGAVELERIVSGAGKKNPCLLFVDDGEMGEGPIIYY